MICPCCSQKTFAQCCQPIIDGKQLASTPEALMRSRYSAYSTGNIEYIYATYGAEQRSKLTHDELADWAKQVQFVRLEIINAEQLKPLTYEGFVEFVAHYLQGNKHHRLQEKSRFALEQQQWRYIDGQITPHEATAVGRNDLCPCLSGKKYKKCHG